MNDVAGKLTEYEDSMITTIEVSAQHAEDYDNYLNDLLGIEGEISAVENEVKSGVAFDADENGKQIYTNAEKRMAEVTRRLIEDNEYAGLKAREADVKAKAAEAKREINANNAVVRYLDICMANRRAIITAKGE